MTETRQRQDKNVTKHWALVVEWQTPDDADHDAAMRAIVDKFHQANELPAERVTAYAGVSAELIAEAVRTESADTQWGYAYVDSPTAVVGPVPELHARRTVDGDYSAVLHRREVVDGVPGLWKVVETR